MCQCCLTRALRSEEDESECPVCTLGSMTSKGDQKSAHHEETEFLTSQLRATLESPYGTAEERAAKLRVAYQKLREQQRLSR